MIRDQGSGIRDRGSGIGDQGSGIGEQPSVVIAKALAIATAPCITSSFQAECVVLTHMLLESAPRIPVLFLDTVHHFAETYAYRDDIAERWKLNLINLRAAEPQPGLWRESTERCCAVH